MSSREENQLVVDEYTFYVGRYMAVKHDDALQMLGEKVFALMMSDKVRCHGPTVDTVFPWNVVDYLA